MKRARVAIGVALAAFGACRTYDVTYTDSVSCDGGSSTNTTLTTCNGQPCVDLTSDRDNCGSCGNTCTANETCVGAECVACASNVPTSCPTGGGPGFCTNLLTDTENCGACGNACEASVCANGHCVCPLTQCGAACVDTDDDVSHCGGCDTPCPPAGPGEIAICSKGQCSTQCVSPFADCDGVGSNGCETNLLSDATNCGACGRACASLGACVDGACPIETYTTGTDYAALAVDDTHVYFVDQGSDGGIDEIPIGDTTITSIATDNAATALVLDSNRIAWLHVNTSLESQLLGGNTPDTIAVALSGVQTIAAANGYVYFATVNTVGRVATDGSSPAVTITSASAAQSLAVDASEVYYADNVGDIWHAPITQQNASSLLFGADSAIAIAADASTLYWITTGGLVMSQPKSQQAPATELSSNESINSNLVTDGTTLYWADGGGAGNTNIRRMSVTGGGSKIIASKQGSVRVVAVDATHVYWTAQTSTTSVIAATTK